MLFSWAARSPNRTIIQYYVQCISGKQNCTKQNDIGPITIMTQLKVHGSLTSLFGRYSDSWFHCTSDDRLQLQRWWKQYECNV